MDNMLCDGNEKELTQCRFEGWGKSDCESSEAAGVVCKKLKSNKPKSEVSKMPKFKIHNTYKMDVRLKGGRVKTEGKVEVFLTQ